LASKKLHKKYILGVYKTPKIYYISSIKRIGRI